MTKFLLNPESSHNLSLEPIIISDSQSIELLLTDTINRVRSTQPNGAMDIRTANATGFLASKLLEAKILTFAEKMLVTM